MTNAARARAIATGALLGDPPPGRTPWAEPLKPNEVPRTGVSPTSAAFAAPEPQYASIDQIRSSEDERAEPSPQEVKRLCGPADDEVPKQAETRPKRIKEPAVAEPDQGAATAPEGLRPIAAINTAGVTPTTPSTTGPIFEWVDPSSLLVNEAYQRNLSERSISLIRRIIGGWDWTKFKPPVCSLGDHGLEVIDGQHTAIAAASHPNVSEIPVMIVETATVQARASAFIGQNTDRLGVTKMQLHRAAVAAGDEDALTLEQVCERSGVRLVNSKPHVWKAGDSLAVGAIATLINKRNAAGARKVLELLVAAEAAPVTAPAIKAVEMILFDPEYGEADPEALPAAIKAVGPEGDREAAVFATAHRVPLWRGLGVVWFRKCRKRRAAA